MLAGLSRLVTPRRDSVATQDPSMKLISDQILTINGIPINLIIYEKNGKICVSIQSPDIEDGEPPKDIVLVIDVSGSMSTPIVGGDNQTNLSILDLVKFTMKVVIKGLRSIDRLTIIKYSTNASKILEPTYMTEANQTSAFALVDTIHTEGSTNMWMVCFRLLNQLNKILFLEQLL